MAIIIYNITTETKHPSSPHCQTTLPKETSFQIGAVHLTNIFGDSRKVGLVLTPPLENDNTDEPSSKKEKGKRKRGGGDEKSKNGGKKKKDKLRFRIRLVFGIK